MSSSLKRHSEQLQEMFSPEVLQTDSSERLQQKYNASQADIDRLTEQLDYHKRMVREMEISLNGAKARRERVAGFMGSSALDSSAKK